MAKRTTKVAKKRRNGSTAPSTGHNSLDAANECLKAVEEWNDFIATEKGKFAKRVKDAKVEISGHYAAAKERGVNTKAIKTLVKVRALDRSKQRAIEELDLDGQAQFHTYAEQMELPLSASTDVSDDQTITANS